MATVLSPAKKLRMARRRRAQDKAWQSKNGPVIRTTSTHEGFATLDGYSYFKLPTQPDDQPITIVSPRYHPP